MKMGWGRKERKKGKVRRKEETRKERGSVEKLITGVGSGSGDGEGCGGRVGGQAKKKGR
jgi:hypothetical protein